MGVFIIALVAVVYNHNSPNRSKPQQTIAIGKIQTQTESVSVIVPASAVSEQGDGHVIRDSGASYKMAPASNPAPVVPEGDLTGRVSEK